MKEVAVTGGSGYIASRLVYDLLQKGYKVRTTVRNISNKSKTQHLTSLPNAAENLTLHEADLLEDKEKFIEIFSGCEAVFHTASPFFYNFKDPEKELLQPAVEGTRTVFHAALSANIKTIIITSSFAAIYYSREQMEATTEITVTESNWSEEEYMREKGHWYPLSKTLAEKEAWNIVNDYNAHHPADQSVRLVSINPSFVIGPLLQPTLNTSSELILDYLTGKKVDIINRYAGFVDVRDVSNAHIIAFENEKAIGRYLCVAGVYHFQSICEILRNLNSVQSLNPPHNIPTVVQNTPTPAQYQVDTSKLRSLSWTPIDIPTSLNDSITSLLPHYNQQCSSK